MAGEAEQRLYDATMRGHIATIQEVLQEYPHLLDRASSSFAYSRNLLHIATMWEQVAVVDYLLGRNPRLAEDLDSMNSSPLHIAAENGNMQIVSTLLLTAPKMSWLLDSQGMNPIHIAAMNGHVDVLNDLLLRNHVAAMERLNRGQTVLHLCVKHGQLGTLQVLVDKLGDLVLEKDDDGETLLHWAVRCNQLEIVEYLVRTAKVDVMSRNSMRYTPMAITETMPLNDTTKEIQRTLREGMQFFRSATDPNSRMRDAIMVVVALIASAAFAAIIAPPGGVWQDDSATHKAGLAVMASVEPLVYKHFVGLNTLAFVASMITIFMMIPEHPSLVPISSTIAFFSFTIALASVTLSYGLSLMMIIPNPVRQSTHLVFIAYLVMLFLLSLIFIRAIFWKRIKQRL